MTAAFFDYPKAADFGRVVPKSRIYEHAGASTALRDLFVTQVDQIVWKYKLAPETTNLAATKTVGEIQVFGISLRTGKLDDDDAARRPLPVALNLGGLYDALITALMPKAVIEAEHAGEDIQARVARMEAIRVKTREVDRIKARLAREKQFNKRVAINAELRAARQELERLSGSAPVTAPMNE